MSDDSFSGTMRQILDKGGLKMKVIVSCGEPDEADNGGGGGGVVTMFPDESKMLFAAYSELKSMQF